MKKLFFFFLIICFPFTVSAGSMKSFELKNGKLSRNFESDNNIYSILLEEGEEKVKFDYTLEENAKVVVRGDTYQAGEENVMEMEVETENGIKEKYTFYLEKEETTPVFQEYLPSSKSTTQKEIPHLKLYVITGCVGMILILFKCIVLGFKK